jgi:hypothetical protein
LWSASQQALANAMRVAARFHQDSGFFCMLLRQVLLHSILPAKIPGQHCLDVGKLQSRVFLGDLFSSISIF